MTKNRSYHLVYALLALLLASMACASVAPATPTPIPAPTKVPATNTPLPTSTPQPTFTPKPTFTSTPIPTPTKIPELGKPISSENWEITVFDVIFRERIYPGGGFYYTPNPGYMFIDVGLKVKSLSSNTTVFSSDILIVDETGEGWPALWSGEKESTGEEIDPFSIGINEILDEDIDFSKEKFLRLTFILKEDSLEKEVTFNFEDVPSIPFTIEK